MLNEDGSHNSASNPARPGSTVTVFVTGSGSTAPGAVPMVTPLGNLTPAAPIGTIAGRTDAVLQVRATIPAIASPGRLPFVIGPAGSPVWTNFLYIGQ